MNVKDNGMWVNPTTLPTQLKSPTLEAVRLLLELRLKTFIGFAELEAEQGVITTELVASDKLGQDQIRLLWSRTVEELLEADEAKDWTHVQEEIIDAVNYFWAIIVAESTGHFQSAPVIESFVMGWLHIASTVNPFSKALSFGEPEGTKDWSFELAVPFMRASNDLLSKLRNRSWQRQAQSVYFDGMPQLEHVMFELGCLVAGAFDSEWDEFVALYISKDNVLQHRLETKY